MTHSTSPCSSAASLKEICTPSVPSWFSMPIVALSPRNAESSPSRRASAFVSVNDVDVAAPLATRAYSSVSDVSASATVER